MSQPMREFRSVKGIGTTHHPNPTTGLAAPIREPRTEEPREYRQFFVQEYRPLLAIALSMMGDRSSAEDVVQEALLRAHKHWARISEYDKPGAWARRVVINLALSRRDRRRREEHALVRLGNRPEPPTDADGLGDDRFWAAVRQLPPKQRAAIVLHYVEDRSVADIAELLECAEGTAKAHLHKGRQRLASVLGATLADADERGDR